MKTLEMLIKAEKDGKLYRNVSLYYSKQSGFHGIIATEYSTFKSLNDVIRLDGWSAVVKVSGDEKAILRNLKCLWLARDANGNLCAYNNEPIRESSIWHNDYGDDYFELDAFNHLFQMVQWTDNEPTLIEDLLKG